MNEYQIIRGKDRKPIKRFIGSWNECEREVQRIGGCYARRLNKGRKPKPKEENNLRMQSKQLRRRRAFLALPEDMQISDVIWELEQIGLPCLAQMAKERLESPGKN